MQNVRLVRIDYSIEKAETGVHFRDSVLHTDNQIRRARCWFPCIDDNIQQCWYGTFNTSFVCACSHFIVISVCMLTFYSNNNIYHLLREIEFFFLCCSMFSYDLEFTVAHNLVAVSTGSLLYQVEMNDISVLEF